MDVRLRNVPFVDDPHAPGQRPEFTTLAADYIETLERRRDSVREIMRTIAEAPEGGILIHCHAGKDRTGITSALLLTLAGVSKEVAAEDYALTSECLRQLDEEWLANGPNDRTWREQEYEKFRARAEVMLEVLEHIDRRYGSTEAYLLDVGVTPHEIERLRARVL